MGLVNTDICVSGPIAKPQASPVLTDVVIDGLKHADDPTESKGDGDKMYFPDPDGKQPRKESKRSYYDFWWAWANQDKKSGEPDHPPKIKLLGSGTDHAPFAFYAGVPCINLRFKDDAKVNVRISFSLHRT